MFCYSIVASKFDLLDEILNEPFLLCTPIGDIIRAERVYTDFQITVLDRVTYADLMNYHASFLYNFWYGYHNYYATIDYRNRVVRF